jgi:glycosyltransferase involved in cell wall biosynthesis
VKILVLSHISELLGGAERSMLTVLDEWHRDHNIEPVFILRQPVKSLAGALDERGWKYYALRYTFWSDGRPPTEPYDVFTNAYHNNIAIKEIENIIIENGPDIVLTNSVVCPWAALAAHYQSVPHVWFVREYGDLDHGRIFEMGRQKTLEDVGNLSELVVANSKALEKHLSGYVDSAKLTTLYTPFKLSDLEKSAKSEKKNPYKHKNSLKLVVTGNLASSKGQHLVVEAVGKLVEDRNADIELCVIGRSGDPTYSKKVEEILNTYNITDRVHMLGYQTSPLPFVAAADIGVMASRREAFGRTTFEYLALSKAVVGADSGATPEMVKRGINGYLFQPNDVSSLVKAISHYIDEPGLVEKHGKSSRLTAERMMAGNNTAGVVYDRVAEVANQPKSTYSGPINYTHRWLDYTEIAQTLIDNSGSLSVKRLIRIRLRQRLKSYYYRGRSILAKLTGR